MPNKWTFAEWDTDPWTGSGNIAVAGSSFSQGPNGTSLFYVEHNPSGVTENNESTIKEFETVDGENIRINTFRPGDNKRKTFYDIKLEYQSYATYRNVKFLFNNAKKFKLYFTDPKVVPNAPCLYLSIDDFNVEWVALQGTKQIYGLSLKCRDILTDSTGNPIKWKFVENTARSPWIWTPTGLSETPKAFQSDFSATSADETFKKRSNDIETINGKLVRINPIRIAANGKIERIPSIRNISLKFDYQGENFKNNVLQLYNNSNEFDLYSDSSGSSAGHVGLYVIEDYNYTYMAVRDTNRLYGIQLSLREVEIDS